MKKTLIALAVLGTAAGVAHAQSNVTIYGVMDTGYIYQSGNSWRMGQNQDSKIGFRGVEDLGNGLKATFELERRFDVNDGTLGNTGAATYKGQGGAKGKDWDGAANIGLAGNWGRVRLGRVNELSTETIRKFDPFYQYGVGSMLWSSLRQARLDNTLRYDSPKWAGFNFGLSYSLGDNSKRNDEGDTPLKASDYKSGKWSKGKVNGESIDNDGYAINLSYDNYGFVGTANWSRLADSNNASVWNIGIGYKFGPAKVTALYEKTKDKGFKGGNVNNHEDNGLGTNQGLWLLGLEWDIGPGQFDASIQRMNIDDSRVKGTRIKDSNIMKYAVGYTYNLSKRTSVYGQVARTDYDTKEVGEYYTGSDRDDAWGFQVGMTHKF